MEHLKLCERKIIANYVVQPQDYIGVEGELILAKVEGRVVGRTGYLPYNQYEYASSGLNNAIMKMAWYSPPDIEVDKSMRGNGIGLGLLEKLFDQLKKRGFNMLTITQPDGQKRFYSKALGKLFSTGKIISWRYNYVFDLGDVIEARI